MFLEHRAMLDGAWARRPYPGDAYALPFGRAKTTLAGSDITVVTWGVMVERCEAGARASGRAAEVIDLRTLVPLDIVAIDTQQYRLAPVAAILGQMDGHRFIGHAFEIERDAHAIGGGGAEITVELHGGRPR